MLRKIAFISTMAAVLLFLVFMCMCKSSLYTIMMINVYLIGCAGLILFFSFVFSSLGYKGERKRNRIWFLVFRVVFFIVLVFTLPVYYEDVARPAVNIAFNYQSDLSLIRGELLEYAQTHNDNLPSADKWCDALYENSQDDSIHEILKPDLQWSTPNKMVFNKSLSEIPVKGLDGKLVLLFQSKSGYNLNGGKELMQQSDRYPHVYILFVDGTFGDYDISKNSLRFLDFGLKQVDYLPLKW